MRLPTTIPSGVAKGLSLTLAIAVVFTAFLTLERTWFLKWGATADEIGRVVPGDELVPAAEETVTRGVTIAAPPERVWPWIAQLGQDRAGFYSYEVLEDLAGCEMPGETRVLPGKQTWQPGDKLWMYPPEKLNGVGGAPLVAYREGRHLVFATRQLGTPVSMPEDATWGFYLEPAPGGSTRLIARGRAPGFDGLGETLFNRLLFEPAHYVMERRMLLNVRALAEGRVPSRFAADVTVILWTLTVVILLAALVRFFRRRAWGTPLLIAAGAALVFQFLTLAQPPVAIAGALVAVLLGALLCTASQEVSRTA